MGVNERGKIQMSPEEIEAFLQERHSISLASIGPDGKIHLIAMWYGLVDGLIAFETKSKSQKVQNLRRNDTITVMIETGETYDQLRGVEIVGRAEIIEDRDRLYEIGISVFSRYNAPYTEEMRPFVEQMLHKRVGVVVHPEKFVSWDHRKLGMPAL